MDYTAALIPELIITNCEFRNFIAHKYAKSLISFNYAAKIVITSTIFDNLFFRYGIISNSLNEQIDRQGVFQQNDNTYRRNIQYLYSSTSLGLNCKSFGHSFTNFCHSLTIDACTFSKFNPYLFTKAATPVFEEGMALALSNVQGPIVVKNSVFSQMVTFTNHEYTGTTAHQGSYNCQRLTKFPGVTTASFFNENANNNKNNNMQVVDELLDVVATSNYKLYIDKHIRKYLYKKREIGSVMHIKNVTFGLILYNNSFS
jgi:hypothetical protein